MTHTAERKRLRPEGKPSGGKVALTAVWTLLLLAVALYFLFPLYWLFISSSKNNLELFNSSMLLPGTMLIRNLKWLASYEHGIFWRWIFNSFFYASVTAVLSTLFSSMGGYALTKYNFRLKRSVYSGTLAALMIPQAATILPVFMMVRSLRLINTPAGVILPMLASPFGIYFMTVYISGALSDEILDAGRVDGASDYRIFFQISVPIIRPGIVTLVLLSFISTWNNFFLPLVLLNQASKFPVTVGLNILVSHLTLPGLTEPLYPLILIGAAISILPIMCLFTVLRKYITSGIALGSLKM